MFSDYVVEDNPRLPEVPQCQLIIKQSACVITSMFDAGSTTHSIS